jgi:NADH:ubiquinone oxidoreductase subunit F (NADH-binding)
VQIIQETRLRGRGGAGYPTGRKWELMRQQPGTPKFIICNADEGDPGAFMDRTMIEGDPHRLLEGMLIAARHRRQPGLYLRAAACMAVDILQHSVQAVQQLWENTRFFQAGCERWTSIWGARKRPLCR